MKLDLDKTIPSIRNAAVVLVATGGVLLLSVIAVLLIRASLSRGLDIFSVAGILISCLFIGGIVIYLLCMAIHYIFSYWRNAHLQKAIRLSEAMQMMHAHMHHEKVDDVKRYSIRIFKSETALPHGVTEDVHCNEISTFLSPLFFNIDRLNAFGSPYYCCDFAQIQDVIKSIKAKWGTGEQSGAAAPEIAALERTIADLREKTKEITGKYTAASGREARLKKQQAEANNHVAILVELANRVTKDFKPPDRITIKEIKAKYLAIGKIYGITDVPDEYVDIFRKAMPEHLINWGGAPSQGSGEEET